MSSPKQASSSQSSHGPNPEVIELDPRGDFTIVARDDDHNQQIKRFLVSSNNLKLNSPVWRAMLESGRWRESTTKKLDLSEDHFGSLKLVLDICHFRFGSHAGHERPREAERLLR